MANYSLTQKQHHVLEFIQRYFDEHRQSPLIREIQCGCQIVSYKSTLDRLFALERKKFITRIPNRHRGIRLVRRASEPILPARELSTVAPSLQSVAETT